MLLGIKYSNGKNAISFIEEVEQRLLEYVFLFEGEKRVGRKIKNRVEDIFRGIKGNMSFEVCSNKKAAEIYNAFHNETKGDELRSVIHNDFKPGLENKTLIENVLEGVKIHE